jgi:hypothetical protein
MRELLYEAAKHYRQGTALMEQGDRAGAASAFGLALRELEAVRPQRNRDVLLAQVYLSRHQLDPLAPQAASDLRMGYGYARTTAEPNVRALAERLWDEAVASGRHLAPASARKGGTGGGRGEARGEGRGNATPGEGRSGRSRRGRGKRGGRNTGPGAAGGGNPGGASS